MLVALAIILGAVFLWQLLEGVGLVAWGLWELLRQLFESR